MLKYPKIFRIHLEIQKLTRIYPEIIQKICKNCPEKLSRSEIIQLKLFFLFIIRSYKIFSYFYKHLQKHIILLHYYTFSFLLEENHGWCHNKNNFHITFKFSLLFACHCHFHCHFSCHYHHLNSLTVIFTISHSRIVIVHCHFHEEKVIITFHCHTQSSLSHTQSSSSSSSSGTLCKISRIFTFSQY